MTIDWLWIAWMGFMAVYIIVAWICPAAGEAFKSLFSIFSRVNE